MTVPDDYGRHVGDAVKQRALDEGMGRMRTAMFVAMMGPVSIAALKLFSWPPESPWIYYGIIATAPLGFLMLIASWLRMPAEAKFIGKTFVSALFTLAAAASTYPILRFAFPPA